MTYSATKQQEDSKIAIVIPVYNTAPYLRECLDSILSQTYKNFTIFAVDDGSTDGSGNILDEYSNKDERIIVFHKKNGGVSSARNTALTAIEQINDIDFISFIDSDDYISTNYLEQLVSKSITENSDIVICGIHFFDHNGEIAPHTPPFHKNTLSKEDFISLIFSIGVGANKIGWGGFLPKQLFRAQTVRGIRFPSGDLIEDEYYCVKAASKANIIKYTPKKLYFYRQRPTSLSHSEKTNEKLVAGRNLCFPIASTISKTAGELASAAYASSLVNHHRETGRIYYISKECLNFAKSATKGSSSKTPVPKPN